MRKGFFPSTWQVCRSSPFPHHRTRRGASIAIFLILLLLHLDSLTEGTAKLPLAMEDVPLQLRHRDTTVLTRHADTIAALLCREQSHSLRGRAGRREVQRGLLVRFRMLLSPELQQKRRHPSEDNAGPMDLCMAGGAKRDHQRSDRLPGNVMMDDDRSFVASGCIANPATISIPFEHFLPKPSKVFLILPLQGVADSVHPCARTFAFPRLQCITCCLDFVITSPARVASRARHRLASHERRRRRSGLSEL